MSFALLFTVSSLYEMEDSVLTLYFFHWYNQKANHELRGTIPSEFGTMVNLASLSLGTHSIGGLTGTLPTELGLLTNSLKFFSISRLKSHKAG